MPKKLIDHRVKSIRKTVSMGDEKFITGIKTKTQARKLNAQGNPIWFDVGLGTYRIIDRRKTNNGANYRKPTTPLISKGTIIKSGKNTFSVLKKSSGRLEFWLQIKPQRWRLIKKESLEFKESMNAWKAHLKKKKI